MDFKLPKDLDMKQQQRGVRAADTVSSAML